MSLLQILTIAELFNGKKPQIPLVDPTYFKKAQAEQEIAEQAARLRSMFTRSSGLLTS